MTDRSTTGRRRRGSSAAALVLTVTLLGACTGQVERQGAKADDATLTLPTCAGTEKFTTPKTRVAVTEQGVLDTIAALGVADRVVARSGTATAVDPANAPLFARVPEVGSSAPSTEGLLGTRPDLVVQARHHHLDPAQGGADPARLRAAGAQIYPARSACAADLGLPPDDTLDGILTDITNIGALLGVRDRAAALTGRLRARRDAVKARVSGRPRVAGVELCVVGGQLYATGAGLPAEMLDLAGMDNLFADRKQIYVPVSPEAITARNPRVIIILTFPTEDTNAQLRYVRRTFPGTDAVRAGRIGTLASRKVGPASPAAYDGLDEIARFLHPRAG